MPDQPPRIPADLIALAERVEAAERPSRELDAQIHFAIHARIKPLGTETWAFVAQTFNIPRYTASVDAAQKLVPDGCVWFAGTDHEVPGMAHVNWPGITTDDRPANYDTQAASPALALCAAALRARAASLE